MSTPVYAFEVEVEDAMSSSTVEWAWTPTGILEKAEAMLPSLDAETRLSFFTLALARPATMYTYEDVQHAVEDMIHDGAKPTRTWDVPDEFPAHDDDASEHEVAAWRALCKAREAIIVGDLWGHPHYMASQVNSLLNAVDEYATERAMRRSGN